MSRSLKKAPYVEEKLYTRICAMNEKKEKASTHFFSLLKYSTIEYLPTLPCHQDMKILKYYSIFKDRIRKR